MASIVWPPALPQRPRPQGFRESPRGNTVRTGMEVGPPKMRRRSTANIDAFTETFDLDNWQRSVLRNFYFNTTEGGALRFDMEHPIDGNTVEMRFRSEPQFRPIGGDSFIATVELEILP